MIDAELIRPKPLAKTIGIGISTLWLWVKTGKFPKPFKLGAKTTVWKTKDV
ncbi:MAG: helix-turn-helix transcriptional regulator, partial [Bacteroidales bacterium]